MSYGYKPANCLLQKGTWNLVLADFGLAIKLQYNDNKEEVHMLPELQGTPGFVAPELSPEFVTPKLNREPGILYSKLDVYAMGVVFLQMLTGFDLCKYFKNSEFCFQQNPGVKFCKNKYIRKDMRKYRKRIRNLLNSMCKYNPDERLTAEDVFEQVSELFNNYDINVNDILSYLDILNSDNKPQNIPNIDNRIEQVAFNKYIKLKSKYMKLKKLIF